MVKIKIPLIDLQLRYKKERKDLLKIIDDQLKLGNLVLTKEVRDFEEQIAKYQNQKFAIGLNSGTDAILMALWSLGIGKGDEVITTPKSFIATIGAIHHVGAIPKLVDIKNDLNIDENLIENMITKKTKAIIPVHWTGRICDMKKINSIAKKHKLIVIEDAAQSIGASKDNYKAGKYSSIACFSAHPLKNLNGIGDSGFLTTNNKKLMNKISLYRNHGLKSRDNVTIFGLNSRLDSINAVVLSYRLKSLRENIKVRNKNIDIYRNYFSKSERIIIPSDKPGELNPYVMFITQSDKRDKLQKYLQGQGIQSMVYYGTPLHKHKAYKNYYGSKIKLPNVEKICKKVLALPHHQYLSESDIHFVCEKISNFYKNN
tara:strand:- start:10648 stop:11763 length:1116 start_codon:yes stop_codon:yes gene_type:complete